MEEKLPKKKRGNLRDKVAMYFLFVAVIPILAMGFIVVYLVNVTSERTILELETQLVRQKNEEIAKFFEETAGVFDLHIPFEIGDIEVVPQVQRENLLAGTLAASRAIEQASFFNLAGQEIGRQERGKDAVPGRDLIDGSKLEKFILAKSGKPYFSAVYYTLAGARITIAYPLKNSADTVVGVLAGDISLQPLARAISFGALGNAGYILLIADSGDLIASSLKDASLHPSIQSHPILERMLQKHILDPQNLVKTYASYWGERVFGYGERVRGLPFVVIAEWPENDALQLAREIRTQALIFSLFMLFAVFLISMIVARRITQPIRLLQQEAKIIGEGKFDAAPLPIKTNDEIEELDEELHEMAKALKTLQQLREEFVFIAAHELRAPVTAIKGYVSMILEEEGKIDPDTKSMLEQVQRANQHLVQLVQDLLEVARSEAGRMKVEVTPQDLAAITRTVVSDLRPLWEERKLAVTYAEASSPLPQVLADPDKLREVLVNLVSNAIKYNREGGALDVWHEVSEQRVITHVRDTGIGLTPEEQAKLFGKFYRAENADTRKVQGTGLGLFIVKQIVEKMDGKIWVNSEREKGSVFSFSLPIA